jgi:hypothetical protein
MLVNWNVVWKTFLAMHHHCWRQWHLSRDIKLSLINSTTVGHCNRGDWAVRCQSSCSCVRACVLGSAKAVASAEKLCATYKYVFMLWFWVKCSLKAFRRLLALVCCWTHVLLIRITRTVANCFEPSLYSEVRHILTSWVNVSHSWRTPCGLYLYFKDL